MTYWKITVWLRGYKKWSDAFCYLPKGYEEESLLKLNEIRKEVARQFAELYPLWNRKNITVKERTLAFYRFLCSQDIEGRLKQKELIYEAAGDLKNAKEYAQIYRIVMDLFDKLVELLGEEAISPEEYAKILDSGFEAAKVGVIPPGYDRVVFGDIERTRLDHIKILFFVGVNDGIIPKTGGADGILSQTERELLGFRACAYGSGKDVYAEILSVSEPDEAVGKAVSVLCQSERRGKGDAKLLPDPYDCKDV